MMYVATFQEHSHATTHRKRFFVEGGVIDKVVLDKLRETGPLVAVNEKDTGMRVWPYRWRRA